MGEDFGGSEQFGHGRDVQDAAAAQGGFEDAAAAAARILLAGPGLDGDDGAQPGGGAGGRHEGAGVRHGADVEQDGADAGLAGQNVEDGRGIEPALEAEADDVAETDAVRLGPVEHGAAQGGGRRDDGERATGGGDVAEGGVQALAGDDDAEGVGADEGRRGGAGLVGVDGDGSAGADFGGGGECGGERAAGDDDEVGGGEIGRAVGEVETAGKAAGPQVGRDEATGRRVAAEQRDAFRVEERLRPESADDAEHVAPHHSMRRPREPSRPVVGTWMASGRRGAGWVVDCG